MAAERSGNTTKALSPARTSRTGSATLAPLETLLEMKRGTALPLTPRLLRVYGSLRMPGPRAHPHVFSNFVSTLDGVVSLNVKGHASGGDISRFSAQDRMVMGLLRAVADIVIIGSGTLRADARHVWTADAIFPAFADDYLRLRNALRLYAAPLNVIVSGSGDVDLRLPVFASGKVPAMIITTPAGAQRLRRQRVPAFLQIRTVGRSTQTISPRAILAAVCEVGGGGRILVEGGPRLLGDFYAARLVDEQFLTIAPQIAGRDADDRRLSLVMGNAFAPRDPVWGKLSDARRGSSHLFLRYSFLKDESGQHNV